MKQKLIIAAFVVAFVLALGWAGSQDEDEARRQAKEYCANVHSGLWPDYNGNYSLYCEKGEYNEQ